MAIRTIGTSPGARVQAGASVLAAAKAVDTRLVKGRLAAFERAHRSYVEAQRKVDAAETQLHAAQARLGETDAVQDDAVEKLARALVADGQPRNNPFAAFGAPSPSGLTRLSCADEVKGVHRLVAAVQRNKSLSKPAQLAAQAADKAARAVEQALAPLDKLQGAVREARHTRDAVAQTWESTLAALKRGVRAAADDGAPQLYATLFSHSARSTTKNSMVVPPPPVSAAAPPAPAPAPPAA